jgi:hypothetical protein
MTRLRKARWMAWAVLNVAEMPAANDPAVLAVLRRPPGHFDEMYRRARIIVAHQREPLRSIRPLSAAVRS